MTRISSAIAAALIASASFAGAALANEGDYYEGASADHNVAAAQTQQVDSYGYTGSISNANRASQSDAQAPAHAQNSGDYYTGANRPN